MMKTTEKHTEKIKAIVECKAKQDFRKHILAFSLQVLHCVLYIVEVRTIVPYCELKNYNHKLKTYPM